jgi:hypothetical protein
MGMPHKYNVAPAEERKALGRTFGSKAEKEYALFCETWVTQGVIKWYICQPKVWLGVPTYTYTPDFLLCPIDGDPHFVDVKGVWTPTFKRHVKMWKEHGRAQLVIVEKRGKKFVITDYVNPDYKDQPATDEDK